MQLQDLQMGEWRKIYLPEASCAFDGDYCFHVRRGDASRLMIYLCGGGVSWDRDSAKWPSTPETAEKYGEEQVKLWRRSYATPPPALEADDERNPAFNDMYRKEDKSVLPLTECLADTVARAIPYYLEEIVPRMKAGERVLVVAHGNSLRALVKYIENVSDDEIVGVNIPTGVPLVYEFDDDMNVLSKRYLGDQDVIAAKINGVANQAKKK